MDGGTLKQDVTSRLENGNFQEILKKLIDVAELVTADRRWVRTVDFASLI